MTTAPYAVVLSLLTAVAGLAWYCSGAPCGEGGAVDGVTAGWLKPPVQGHRPRSKVETGVMPI